MSMRPRSRRDWDVEIDRRTNEWVHERQAPIVAENLRPDKRLDDLRGHFLVEPGEGRRVRKVRTAAEDRDGMRKGDGSLSQRGQPVHDRAAYALRAKFADPRG